jgi:HAD superfamily phosphoserine phosphatase-like hydrolase
MLIKPQTGSMKEFLLLSDFDQTLSLRDSGEVLSESLGISVFSKKVADLAAKHLVQQGGELAYLLVHDADFRKVRSEDLRAAGKNVQLKTNIPLFIELLKNLDGHQFTPYVVSAGPQEIVESALEGIIAPENIFASRLGYNEAGEVCDVQCLRAGYGKVAVLYALREKANVSQHRIVYVGDGSSDIHVMLHVNRLEGLTVAVSENRYLSQIATRTILSNNAMSVLIPILEDILGWKASRIRFFMEQHGIILREWEKVQTDTVTMVEAA